MRIISLQIVAIFLYSGVVLWQIHQLRRVSIQSKWPVLSLALCAIFVHAWLLHLWIDVAGGQNLTVFNMISLVAWLNAFLTVLVSMRKAIENLLLIVCPLALLSILLVCLFPRSYLVDTASHPLHLFHIIIAIFAFSIFCLAALQALLLAWQQKLLRTHKISGLLQMLPPLEATEVLLFQTVAVGFLLLTIMLVSSLFAFTDYFNGALLHKTLLTMLAWCIFAILLAGRYFLGWRGQIAINYTLCGVGFLVLSYFGSRVLLSLSF
jgi:ABC-type uncharacterized transport system permease subunit